MSRMFYQQIFKNRDEKVSKNFNICLFSSKDNLQFWHKPDFSMTRADDEKIKDIELWLDCLDSDGDCLIGLEKLMANKSSDQKVVVITNRQTLSAEFLFSLENISGINATILTDSSVKPEVVEAYKKSSKAVFKAFSEAEKSLLIGKTKEITTRFSKANYDELFSWSKISDETETVNEYFLPKIKNCSELDKLFQEFNKTIKSLLDLSSTYKQSEIYYSKK